MMTRRGWVSWHFDLDATIEPEYMGRRWLEAVSSDLEPTCSRYNPPLVSAIRGSGRFMDIDERLRRAVERTETLNVKARSVLNQKERGALIAVLDEYVIAMEELVQVLRERAFLRDLDPKARKH